MTLARTGRQREQRGSCGLAAPGRKAQPFDFPHIGTIIGTRFLYSM